MKQPKPTEHPPQHQSAASPPEPAPRNKKDDAEKVLNHAPIYQQLFDIAPEGIMILDAQTGQIVDVNTCLTRMLNCTRQEFLSRTYADIFSLEDISAFHEAICNLRAQKHICHPHVPLKTKNGQEIQVIFDCHLFESGDREYVKCSMHEQGEDATIHQSIAAFKTAQEKLRQSEEKYHNILENIDDGYYETDLAGNFTFCNEALCRIWGYSREELMGMNNRRYMDQATASRIYKAHNDVFRTGKPGSQFDYEIIRKDGTNRIVQSSFSLLRDHDGNPAGFQGIVRDVTAQKKAEEALRKSEEQYKQAFSSTSDVILMADSGLHISSITPSVERILGYAPSELIGRRVDELTLFAPLAQSQAIENIRQIFNGETVTKAVFEFIARNGNSVYGEITASPIRKDGAIIGMIAIARDVTERKTMEESIVKNEMRYRTIVENSQEGIFQASPQSGETTINKAFASILGYASTHEAESNIESIPRQLYVNPDEHQKVLDIVRAEGGIKGYETEFYRRDKSRIWVSMSVSAVRDTEGNLLYYHGIVEDITPKKKLEQERQDSIHRLRRSLGATINAMSATVEARDPYTAGHQRRVADLARAIATEMKLSRDQIDGIRLAGMIHDIGKISVPSEILTKPTRLTTLEFELIKTHSEAGFNILKDIEFPWPIARIVLEHHERINGTGYPQGVKGEDILLESKIIAVADVVEAISSNRPYRPAFGLEPALEEIEKNSGVLYDKDAASACLKLFHENLYKMPF